MTACQSAKAATISAWRDVAGCDSISDWWTARRSVRPSISDSSNHPFFVPRWPSMYLSLSAFIYYRSSSNLLRTSCCYLHISRNAVSGSSRQTRSRKMHYSEFLTAWSRWQHSEHCPLDVFRRWFFLENRRFLCHRPARWSRQVSTFLTALTTSPVPLKAPQLARFCRDECA